jgi:N-formylglutamate amidohydrolase
MAERRRANQRDAKSMQFHSFGAEKTTGETTTRPAASARRHVLPDVLFRLDPMPGPGQPDGALPLVFDSPHSGAIYPADFGHAAPLEILRRAEDAFVDELFADAPAHGASLLAALFPRSYIDPNRHEADIDLSLLDGAWPHALAPTRRSRRGLGLIRRILRGDLPLYDRRLSVAEVKARIDNYYRPYHAELEAMLDAAHGRWRRVWHVNCHSMRALGRKPGDPPFGGNGRPRADFVLGDLDGEACDGEFRDLVQGTLTAMGYRVVLNKPFKGAELVARYSDPAAGRHSLQIEINRRLYMDERAVAKTADFATLKTDIDRLIAEIAGYVRERAGSR